MKGVGSKWLYGIHTGSTTAHQCVREPVQRRVVLPAVGLSVPHAVIAPALRGGIVAVGANAQWGRWPLALMQDRRGHAAGQCTHAGLQHSDAGNYVRLQRAVRYCTVVIAEH